MPAILAMAMQMSENWGRLSRKVELFSQRDIYLPSFRSVNATCYRFAQTAHFKVELFVFPKRGETLLLDMQVSQTFTACWQLSSASWILHLSRVIHTAFNLGALYA